MKAGTIEYTEDQKPCLVAKMACGHYVAACAFEPDRMGSSLEFIADYRGRAVIEIRPVAFVRAGNLTMGHGCPTHETGGVR